MAQELQDWIAPWVDDHYTKHGTSLDRVYRDGKKIQITRFETYRDPKNPSDRTQIIALATDKVHRVRLIFDIEGTDLYCQKRGKAMTADLRSVYRLNSYQLSLASRERVSFEKHSPLLEIYVKEWDWYWGSPSEIPFCADPVGLRVPLRLDDHARAHREWQESHLGRSGAEGEEREMEEDVFERFKEGRPDKTTEEVRRDASAALAILWETHRPRPNRREPEPVPNDIDPGLEDAPEQEEEQEPDSPPKKTSWEATPYQRPPVLSLSVPTPPTPTPSPPSPDPIAEKLRAGGLDRMELYEMLAQRQTEGKDVDWAFRPAESLGGEKGLERVLKGISVFGLDLDGETDDSDDDMDATVTNRKDPRADRIAGPSSRQPSEEPLDRRPGRMMRMTRPPPRSEPDSYDEDEGGSNSPISDRGTLTGDSSEGEMTVLSRSKGQEPIAIKQRSPTPVWESSPPNPPRNGVMVETEERDELKEDDPARGEVDRMLVDEREPDTEQDQPIQAQTEETQEVAPRAVVSPKRRSETPPRTRPIALARAPAQTTPNRRPNVRRIPLDTPSSDEGEPMPTVLGKRKASPSPTPTSGAPGSERESKREHQIKKLKTLEEQIARMKASMDVGEDDDAPELDVAGEIVPTGSNGSQPRPMETERTIEVDQPIAAVTTLPERSNGPGFQLVEVETVKEADHTVVSRAESKEPAQRRVPDPPAEKSDARRQGSIASTAASTTDRPAGASTIEAGQTAPPKPDPSAAKSSIHRQVSIAPVASSTKDRPTQRLRRSEARRPDGLSVGQVIAIQERFKNYLQQGPP